MNRSLPVYVVVLVAACAGAHAAPAQEQRDDRTGAIQEFGWEGGEVRTRARDVQFNLRRDAYVTVVKLEEDGSIIFVGSGQFAAGRHTLSTTLPRGTGTEVRVPFRVTCGGSVPGCEQRAAQREGEVGSRPRFIEYYLVMATDSAFTADELRAKVVSTAAVQRDVALRELPPYLFGDRTSTWAAIIVRR